MKKRFKKIGKRIKRALILAIVLPAFLTVNLNLAQAISVQGILKEIEETYHLNRESIKNQGENFNVSDNKKSFPQTLVSFSPVDPVEGQKITASALPAYFANEPKNLYYTWYLKHDDNDDNTDWNGDGDINLEDWKIEAARIIAQGGWEPNWKDKKIQRPDDCNFSDNALLGNPKPSDYDEFYDDKDDDDNKQCTDGIDADGYRAGWGGDLANGGREDGGSFNNAETGNDDEAYCYFYEDYSGTAYEVFGSSVSETNFDCPTGEYPKCVEDKEVFCGGGDTYDTFQVCGESEASLTCSSGTPTCSTGTPVCVSSLPSDDCRDITAVVGEDFSCSAKTTPLTSCTENGSSSSGGNGCRHVFPDIKGENSGDGEFGKSEEKFWGTNPDDPDTASNGNFDEANVVGLGQTEFSWTYMEGDEVGVIVEGMSLVKTKHDDASPMVIWATPVKNCSLDGYAKGIYTKSIKDYDVKIPYININNWKVFWETCARDNLIDPRKGGQPDKLVINLEKSPADPINDYEGKRGDVVTVQSSIENLLNNDFSRVLYDWKIQINEKGRMTGNDWATICGDGQEVTEEKNIKSSNDAKKYCVFDKDDVSSLYGNGVSTISFRLNLSNKEEDTDRYGNKFFGEIKRIKEKIGNNNNSFIKDDVFYLKVKLKARENFSATNKSTRIGESEIIIKVITGDNKIQAFIPKVIIPSGQDSEKEKEIYLHNKEGNEDSILICEDNNQAAKNNPAAFIQENYCFVAKNQIVGLKLESESDNQFKDIIWRLDGENLLCDKSVAKDLCDNSKTTNYAFFPITKNVGESYNVSVSATDVQSGKTHNFSRNFVVVNPHAKVVVPYGSNVFKKYLGMYIPLDEEKCKDENDRSCYRYSEDEFEVEEGGDILMEVNFSPEWIANDLSDYQWKVNLEEELADSLNFETIVYEKDDFLPGGSGKRADKRYIFLNIPVGQEDSDYYQNLNKNLTKAGSVFQVDFYGMYNQNQKTRFALSKIWNINQFESTEELLEHSVKIRVVQPMSEDEPTAKAKTQKFFAAVFSNLPENLIFLVRLFLMAAVLIFLSYLAHYSPRRIGDKK